MTSNAAWIRVCLLLILGAVAPRVQADELPYPGGASSQRIEGLQVELVLPRDLSTERKASLVLVLHGAGGTATGMAGTLAPWAQDGYVVAAPKSSGQVWEAGDLAAVRKIVQHLRQVLPIDGGKLHVVGFSNGGWNLPPLAFDETLRPLSATWVAAGFRGANVPDWAKQMGVLALAGTDDPNVGAARETVGLLAGKVRCVEVREQAGLGHSWPEKLMPYFQWWMGVMEGRYTPGDDRSFPWTDDLPAALTAQAAQKKGGVLVWVFDAVADAANPEARALQREVFFDPEVRRLGEQIATVRLTRAQVEPHAARLGFTTTPFLAVLDGKGALKQALSAKIKASALAKALRQVAPKPREPK